MEIIKASLMAALQQSGGSSGRTLLQQIDALPTLNTTVIQSPYSFKIKMGRPNGINVAQSIQSDTSYGVSGRVNYIKSVQEKTYIFFCLYKGDNIVYAAMDSSSPLEKNYYYDYIRPLDLSMTIYLQRYQYLSSFQVTQTYLNLPQNDYPNCSIYFDADWTRHNIGYNEDGTINYENDDSFTTTYGTHQAFQSMVNSYQLITDSNQYDLAKECEDFWYVLLNGSVVKHL